MISESSLKRPNKSDPAEITRVFQKNKALSYGAREVDKEEASPPELHSCVRDDASISLFAELKVGQIKRVTQKPPFTFDRNRYPTRFVESIVNPSSSVTLRYLTF